MGSSQPRKVEEHVAHEFLIVVAMTTMALLQVTLLPEPLGFPPMLLLVLVVCRVLVGIGTVEPSSGIVVALRWAFYGGIALDLFAATLLGSHALALLLAAIVVFVLARSLQVEGPLLPLLAVLLGGTVYEFVLAVVYHYTVVPLHWPTYAMIIVVPSVLLALILALPVFFFLRWMLLQRRRTMDGTRQKVVM